MLCNLDKNCVGQFAIMIMIMIVDYYDYQLFKFVICRFSFRYLSVAPT